MNLNKEMIYSLLKTVPKGRVTTYKELAEAVGSISYRAVGLYLRNNPYSYITCPEQSQRIPCHRVVRSDGTIGGFMGETCGPAIQKKIRLLSNEGVIVRNGRVINFNKKVFTFERRLLRRCENTL
jgi:methylated-DNA-[protein]-cysteine S-methyltransferase